jgi:hypothetical protein
MAVSHLPERGVVRVAGPDARTFLDGLLTCDLDWLSADAARYGGLLTPQGKILFDFILVQAPEEDGGGYYLDALGAYAPDLAKRLGFYKLRAKVTVEDLSGALSVLAGWEGARRPPEDLALALEDPRLAALGWRAIVAREGADAVADAEPEAYHAHRIRLGVPDGGRDFLYGDAFPHEAVMDQLSGVDFDKGCYVGQEVVSRMQHRGTARTRMVPLRYPEGFAAEPGSDVVAGPKTLGRTATGSGEIGLAMLRLDRLGDALAEGQPVLAGGMPVEVLKPHWARFEIPSPAAPAA